MNSPRSSPDSFRVTDGSLPQILRLAAPVLAEESLTMLVGYTDWWLVGHFLGSLEHKAAIGLIAYLLWLIPSLFAAVSIGATALVSRHVGSGDRPQASLVANQALLLGLIFAAVVTVATLIAGDSFVSLMQLQDEAAQLTAQYLAVIAVAIPFIMVEQVGAACLRGAGDTVSSFLAKSIVNVVNVAISTLLIIGPGPIPQLGWLGIAVGTACGHIMGGTIVLALLLKGRAGLHVAPLLRRPQTDVCRRLLKIGVPGGVDVLAVLTCHFIYVAIINGLGTLEAAAHGLGVQIEALAYLPGAAFAVAATTLSGQLLGARASREASQSILLTMTVGCSVMTVAGAIFFFGGAYLTAFFTGDSRDAAGVLTSELLKIVAVSTPFLGMLQILTGALRGAGDTRFPLLITFAGLLVVRIPTACWLAWEQLTIPGTAIVIEGWGWGIQGAWWAMVVDVVLRAGLAAGRFWQGGWKRIVL